MRLVSDIDAQHIVETFAHGAQLCDHGEGRKDGPKDLERLLSETIGRAGREGDAVFGPAAEADRHRQIVAVSARLQFRNDLEAVVRGLVEVEEQPFAGLVHIRERARHVDRVAALPVRQKPHGRPLVLGPPAADPGIFRVQRLDRRGDAIDGEAERVQPLGKARQEVVRILFPCRHEPVAQLHHAFEERRLEMDGPRRVCRGSGRGLRRRGGCEVHPGKGGS